ncbi:hypothetical protein [Streptomyces sp. NPDC096068]|uniref:hypothetical protein n=1 Tax=Streptomyces sp. NPDC096068 TaxID=3155424 RepID=UPI00332C8D99
MTRFPVLPRRTGPMELHRVGHALLLHPRGRADPRARLFAGGLAPDPDGTLVVVDLRPDAPSPEWEAVAALLAGTRPGPAAGPGIRLVIGRGGPRGLLDSAQWLADRLSRPVTAPDAPVRPCAGGGLFVPPYRGTGWHLLRPGRAPVRTTRRFPRAVWESAATDRPWTAGPAVDVEPVPGGVWLRRTGTGTDRPAAGRALPATDVHAGPDLLAVVLGAPDQPPLPPEAVTRFWAELAPDLRALTRFVPYGTLAAPGGDGTGQALADLLDYPVAVFTGLPAAPAPGTTVPRVLVPGDADAPARWPFARQLSYQPRPRPGRPAPPPVLLDHRPPFDGLAATGTPGVYAYAEDTVLEVVQSGLWIRSAAEPPDADEIRRVPPARGHTLVLHAPGPDASRLRRLAAEIVRRVDPDTARTSRITSTAEAREGRHGSGGVRTVAEPGGGAVSGPVTATGTASGELPAQASSAATTPEPDRPSGAVGGAERIPTSASGPVAVLGPVSVPGSGPVSGRPSVLGSASVPGAVAAPVPGTVSATGPVSGPASLGPLAAEPLGQAVSPAAPGPVAPVLSGAPPSGTAVPGPTESSPPSRPPRVRLESGPGDPGLPAPTGRDRTGEDRTGGTVQAGPDPDPDLAPGPDPDAVVVQPVPVAAACAVPPERGVAQERAWLHRTLGGRYDAIAGSVTRLLSELPGLRGGGQTAGDVLGDLVALKLYLSGGAPALDAGIRSAVPGPHVPLARCVASGLRRLPSYRGPVRARVPLSPAAWHWYGQRRLVMEWGFFGGEVDRPARAAAVAEPAPEPGEDTAAPVATGPVDLLVWSMTARRTALIEPDDTRHRVVFLPGTAFKVLRVTGGEHPAVLLRELSPSEAGEDGRIGTGAVPLDRIALAGLEQADRARRADPDRKPPPSGHPIGLITPRTTGPDGPGEDTTT